MKKYALFILLTTVWMTSIHGKDEQNTTADQIKNILKMVKPSMVEVISENHKRYVATGIAIDRHLVLTNSIITRYPYQRIFIRTIQKDEYNAKVVGKDNASSLILLKLDKKVLVPIKKTGKVEIGDWVALVGTFYKTFPSISQGIVSSASDYELILNAPVLPGVSGGAVLNRNGELAGVVRGRVGVSLSGDFSIRDHRSEVIFKSEKRRGRNLCYAIPIQRVMNITTDLKKFGVVKRSTRDMIPPGTQFTIPRMRVYSYDLRGSKKIGVHVSEVTSDLAKKFQIKEGFGLLVSSVNEKSPAKKAGIEPGDIIVRANKKAIKSNADIRNVLSSLKDNQMLILDLYRDGQLKKMELVPEKISSTIIDDDFKKLSDRFQDFSIRLFQGDTTIWQIRDQMNELRYRITVYQGMPKRISDQGILQIQENLSRLQQLAERHYQSKLELLEKERARITADKKQIMQELNRIEQVELKKIKQLHKNKRNKRDDKDKEKVKNITF